MENIIKFLFPQIDNYEQFKIDNDSIHYITPFKLAEQMSNIIMSYMIEQKINVKECIITDCFAGVGGNTLSFCKYFKNVNAIEIDKLRFEYLVNNIEVFKQSNVLTFNSDFLTIYHKLTHDIVFIDPPWGGSDYKIKNNIKITVSEHTLEDICNMLMESANKPRFIFIKLPKNYDLFYLYQNVKNCHIRLHDELKKVNLIVIKKE